MEYDLKKTKTSDAETLTHCLTAVSALLKESEEAFLPARKWREAEEYLKDYIFELFEQNK